MDKQERELLREDIKRACRCQSEGDAMVDVIESLYSDMEVIERLKLLEVNPTKNGINHLKGMQSEAERVLDMAFEHPSKMRGHVEWLIEHLRAAIYSLFPAAICWALPETRF